METSTHKKITILILAILLVIAMVTNVVYKVNLNKAEDTKDYYREQVITLYHITELEHNISKECTKKIGIEYNAELTPLENILVD